MATTEEIENAKKLKEEYEELRNLSRDLTDDEKERLETLEKLFEQLEKTVERTEAAADRARVYLENMDKVKKTVEVQNLKLEATLSFLNAQKELQIALIKNGDERAQQAADELANLEEQIKAIKEIAAARQRNTDILEYESSLTTKVKDTIIQMHQSGGQKGGLLGKSLLRLADSGADAFMGRLTGAAKEAFFSFDELSKAFERQYAMGEDFTEQTRLLYKDLSELSVSMEDLTQAAGSLIDNFTDFTLHTKEQQKALRETANIMEKSYGVAFDDFSKGLQVSTKMMGMSTAAAKNLSAELAATADALDVSVPGLVTQFASMGPSLAKFGTEGVKHFKELARISKLTGLEIEKLLTITEKFDTFEGAAERAGMLNAALGGNFVNAMDLMMTTDPAARFQMIRDAIDQTGVSFNDMGYYQKQFFAEAAGLESTADLALLMSGNMDLLTGATNQSADSIIEQRQRAADLQSIMEKLQAVFVNIASSVTILQKPTEEIVETFKNWAIGIGAVVVGLKAYGLYLGIASARAAIKTAATLADISAGGVAATMTASQTAALIANTTAVFNNAAALELRNAQLKQSIALQGGTSPVGASGMATKAATIGMLAVAFVAFGAAVYTASLGVEKMAAALKDLNADQLDALTTIFVTMSVVLVGLAVGVLIFGKAAEASALGLLAFGATVFMIGAGIGIAAAGIGAMAEGFSTLADVGLGTFAAQLGLVTLAIYGLAAGLAALANPASVLGFGVLAGLGIAAAGIGALVGFFKKDDNPEMEEMGVMFEKMGKVDLTGAKQAFNSIAQSVNRTDIDRLEGYTAVAKNLIINNPVAAATTPQKMLPMAFAGAGAGSTATSSARIKHDPIEVDIKINHAMFRAEVKKAQNEADKVAAPQ